MRQRTRLAINAGNLLELVGAGAVVYGVDRLVGLSWALVLAGILLVVAAELIYDSHVWRVPLPRRPRPRVKAREWRQRFVLWRIRRVNPRRDAAVAWLRRAGS